MQTWKVLTAIAIVVGVLTLSGAQARQGAGAPAGGAILTAMDYVQLRQLVARYAFALDTGANNGYEYADLFTADGEFVNTKAKGREQLAALARGEKKGPWNTLHYVMNPIMEPTATGAVGRQYLIEINHDNNAPGAGGRSQWSLVGEKRGDLDPTGGHYEDVYVKTPQGWRFKSRQFVPSKSGPQPGKREMLPMVRVQPHPSDTVPTMPGGLTTMDYIEIEALVASYGHALDSGYGFDDNGEAYAGLYTSDATFGQSTGHDQLARLAREQPQGSRYVRHYLTNHVIEPWSSGAIGKQYLVVIDVPEPEARAAGKPGSIFLGGHYEDVYERTPAGWRIKTRRLFRAQTGLVTGR